MSERDEDLDLRPGRIGDRGRSRRGAQSFTAEVLAAARKAGHTGKRFTGSPGPGRARASQFGRGRFVAPPPGRGRAVRRVVVKARVVRHRGARFRAAPLAKHLAYLGREGAGRDGRAAELFGPEADAHDPGAFAARCAEDRHHFRFIISPEDAAQLHDIRAFTRDLLAEAARDLHTKLDWVAVAHANTDNPHVHVLVRGVAEDGADLVISRDYIAHGLRARAEALLALELGPRTAREIAASLEAEVGAERWTGLDKALRLLADERAGFADLRPGAPGPQALADPDTHRRMIGRAQTLERLGLAEPLSPGVWRLSPSLEDSLRALALRADIIKTMHQALGADRLRAAGDFAIEDATAPAFPPILGRLAARGLHDALTGEAYAVIDAVDGRVHHLRLPDLDATGDTPVGGIVETRVWSPAAGGPVRLALVGRSDLAVEGQIEAEGATWLDRLALAKTRAPLAHGGFGAEVRAALDARADHLARLGLAVRRGGRTDFAPRLLATLRARELGAAAAAITAETGLARVTPAEGEVVSGVYRRRLDLASGRFVMLDVFSGDGGLGFALAPWRPDLDRRLGQTLTGTLTPGGGVAWARSRVRGLDL